MKILSGRQRAMRAVNAQEVDYPPSWAPIICNTKSIEEIIGRVDIWDNPQKAYLKAFRILGVDMINQFIAYSPGQFEARGGVVDANIAQLEPEDVVAKIKASFPRLRKAIDAFNETSVAANFRKSALDGQALVGEDFLWIQYGGAFSIPGMKYGAYGYIPFFTTVALYPDVMDEIWALEAEYGTKYNKAIVRAMEEGKLPRVIRLDHDMTDNRGSIVNINTMDRIYFPHFETAIKPFVDAGVRLVWHSDGNITEFIPRLLKAGVNGFQGFQEEWGVDYEYLCNLKDKNGAPLMIWGSVSVTTVLPYGTPDDVRADVRRCWRIAPDRGYFLGATSSICPEVPTENIIAMWDEQKKCVYS